MAESSAPREESSEGAPAWVMTFADLMSLLMCFFVLLLSFSEMDVLKFKELAGSMKQAFGVQREIEQRHIPKGTSIIAKEFSPGRPQPTPIKQMREQTTNETKDNLDFTDATSKQAEKDVVEELVKENVSKLAKVLKKEINRGLLEIETQGYEIMIRIREKGSFDSGSAKLRKSFLPTLKKIGRVLKSMDGKIVVAGHTDNVPISTSQYPSNWVLSAARSATVVHYLTKFRDVTPSRIQIRAHADTQPVAPNKTSINRAKNRRVDIIVQNRFGQPQEGGSITELAGLKK
jgi:chemotaxis protein MotB